MWTSDIADSDLITEEKADFLLAESKAQEGKTRLVLPAELLSLNEEAIAAFNSFKDAMQRSQYDEIFHKQKVEAFSRIQAVKDKFEAGLRDFLRTEQLLRGRS